MGKNNIEKLNCSLCTGCGLCKNLCPENAIEMEVNEEGFVFPVVNSKCINCGICADYCPQMQKEIEFNNLGKFYAMWCIEEIRQASSSGGVFGAIAKYVLDKGGVVYGAAFDDEKKYLSHVKVSNKSELPSILKSKYLQSDMKDVYSDVKKNAEANVLTVFCGCPCQVQAIKNFLQKDYDNVVLIDIICHGVPSPLAYTKFLDEVTGESALKIKNVDFRDKKYGWGSLISVEFSNAETYYHYYDGYYFKAFLGGLSMREACFQCKYAQPKRVGDITLGDFWGVKEISQKLDDGKGTSLVMCNNENGEKLLKKISKYIKKCEQVDASQTIEISKRMNAAVVRPTWFPHMRKCFFNHLLKDSFSKSVRYAETSLLDVGILGWWNETPRSNYGSTLTNFALYKYILSLGLSVAFVSPPNFDRKKAGEFNLKQKYRMTAKYDEDNMLENNKYIDTFIVGSDVLWYYDAFIRTNYFFLLDFVSDEKNKISYATSFGNSKRFFPNNELPKAKRLLKRFDSVSVRELEGVEICKNKFSVDATQVLDPVFLCEKNEWTLLSNSAERRTKKDFLFAYILDPTNEISKNLQKIAAQLELKLISVTDKQFNNEGAEEILRDCGILRKASIYELMYHFENSKYVITDSYHGMCFSLIFEKPFVARINRERGGSRFETLSEVLGVSQRIVEDLSEVEKNIDKLKIFNYFDFNTRIENAIKNSKTWLYNALTRQKNNNIRLEIDQIKEEIKDLRQIIELIQAQLGNA